MSLALFFSFSRMVSANTSQHQVTPPKSSRLGQEGADVVTQRRAQPTPDRSMADMAPDPYVQSPYIPVGR